MKKVLPVVLSTLFVTALAVPSVASELSAREQKELATAVKEAVDAQKGLISTRVDIGIITRRQGDLMLERVDEMHKYQKENGLPLASWDGRGMGLVRGRFMRNGRGVRPEMGDKPWFNDSYDSSLNSREKKELDSAMKKVFDANKNLIKTRVDIGIMAKKQGDLMLERADEMYKFQKENGFPFASWGGMGMGPMGGGSMRGGRGFGPGMFN